MAKRQARAMQKYNKRVHIQKRLISLAMRLDDCMDIVEIVNFFI